MEIEPAPRYLIGREAAPDADHIRIERRLVSVLEAEERTRREGAVVRVLDFHPRLGSKDGALQPRALTERARAGKVAPPASEAFDTKDADIANSRVLAMSTEAARATAAPISEFTAVARLAHRRTGGVSISPNFTLSANREALDIGVETDTALAARRTRSEASLVRESPRRTPSTALYIFVEAELIAPLPRAALADTVRRDGHPIRTEAPRWAVAIARSYSPRIVRESSVKALRALRV